GDGDALQLGHDLDQPTEPAPRRADALPRGQEPAEGRRLDGLDLLAQRGEGPLTELTQDLGVAPLALGAVGPELAAQQQPALGPAGEQVLDEVDGQAEAGGGLPGGERRMSAGPAAEQ